MFHFLKADLSKFIIVMMALGMGPILAFAAEPQTTAKAQKTVEVDKFGMPLKKLRALKKKHKCVDIVRYREVIPYFGMEKTKEVSKQIAIGVEQKDIDAGIAKLVDVQYDCFPILGNFYVNCTTDVTLCYTKKKR